MQADDHELVQFRVSAPPHARSGELDAFRETYGRKILRFEIVSLDRHPLQFDFVFRSLPDFAMASGSRSPMRLWHTRDLIDNDDILLVVVARGPTFAISMIWRSAPPSPISCARRGSPMPGGR